MTDSKTTYTGTQKRLSLRRVLFAIVIILGLAQGTTLAWERAQETELGSGYESWFAAYVDATSMPTYAFEKPASSEAFAVVLSFIVSSGEEACTPTWGNYYTLDEASASLDLDRRIARLQQLGGRIAVSFGGALNSELALKCTDENALLAAYKSVIERYNINTIDLDLENEGLTDLEAAKRRADVIAKLQLEYQENEKPLAVWLTLPVAPQGLTKAGTDAVAQMLASGVDLVGVNVMTMDYGGSREEGQTMLEASKQALNETRRQLGVLYKQAGMSLSDKTLWQKIGATPMIGQNDVVSEVFTLDDARAFNDFAHSKGVGRMSMWSANRDVPCGENYVDVKVVSDLCSGVKSPKFSFTRALGAGFEGDLMQNASMLTVDDPESNVHIVDDPETSPYQVWQESGVYLKGTKVVWHGNVYEAKWWTKGDLPDHPVLQGWETPWKLVGPVLPGEKPVEMPKLPAGTYPRWAGNVVYDSGDRVLFNGIAFQAKWWNQGESPAAAAAGPDSSPWVQLSQKQIVELLRQL